MERKVHFGRRGKNPLQFPLDNDELQPDFRVAIDFGTTFTSIAFTKRDVKEGVILTIENFPGDHCLGRNGTQVPTEICYLRPMAPSHGQKSVQTGSRRSRWSAQSTVMRSGIRHTRGDKATTRLIMAANSATSSLRNSRDHLYGYQVTRYFELSETEIERKDYAPLAVRRVKLLFDNSAQTQDSDTRGELREVLQELKDSNFIEHDEDVVQDILTKYLSHSKEQLQLNYGFHDNHSVEITFSVPVCWDAKVNAIMCRCVEGAMKRAHFGVNASPANLFMVNEAEAAALHALSSGFHGVNAGDKFLLIDAGGGTTEVGMYQVARSFPLRLDTELTIPTGAAIGATDLNVRMREFALLHLVHEHYLCTPEDGLTMLNIIDTEIMIRFEEEYKRTFNISNEKQRFNFRIRGLKEGANNPRLRRAVFVMSYIDMLGIFRSSLQGIGQLMEDQLLLAHQKNISIDKIILVGGFGDSPALKKYLSLKIDDLNEQFQTRAQFMTTPPNTGATGVATGALMRAQDKSYGPERVPCISYGILEHVEWDPDSNLDYMNQPRALSELDGEFEIRDTIRWVVKAGQGPLAREHRVTFKFVHCFRPSQGQWLAEEEFYASDTCIEDYYQVTHAKNDGKVTRLGAITYDLTCLQGHLQLVSPPADDAFGVYFYQATVLVELVVRDRDLKFAVRWPANDGGGIINGSQTSFSIVAGFKPGTA